ncbi:unnamed protein product, partial [Schistosoma turkestanicum]
QNKPSSHPVQQVTGQNHRNSNLNKSQRSNQSLIKKKHPMVDGNPPGAPTKSKSFSHKNSTEKKT